MEDATRWLAVVFVWGCCCGPSEILAQDDEAAGRLVIEQDGTLPGELDRHGVITSSEHCNRCHMGLETDAGAPYMAWDTWAGSTMANAVRDPLFQAALSVAQQDVPGVGAWCLRCHSFSAFVEGRAAGGTIAALEDKDYEGVQCAICHRSVDGSLEPIGDPDAPYIGNARLYIEPTLILRPNYHGPREGVESTQHSAMKSAFLSNDARLCGQCHQVSNPYVNQRGLQGHDLGRPFPLDTTFEEWSNSAFAAEDGRTCQDCHMPAEPGALLTALHAPGPREHVRRHDFAGGNEWAAALLKAAYPGFRDKQFDQARARSQAMLRSAATLEVRTEAAPVVPGASASITVRVTNESGHKLPTGYADGRRVWLEISVAFCDAAAEVISGAYDEATVHLLPDPQLRIYQAQLGRNGAHDPHLALQDQVLEDTRIPPRGFRATPATAPVGPLTFADETGTIQNFDDATYRFDVPRSARGHVLVRARLMYQATTSEYVSFLDADNRSDSAGSALAAAWEASGRAAPYEMASVEHSLPVETTEAGGCGSKAAPAEERSRNPKRDGCSAGGAVPSPRAPLWVLAALLSLAVGARRAKRLAQRATTRPTRSAATGHLECPR